MSIKEQLETRLPAVLSNINSDVDWENIYVRKRNML